MRLIDADALYTEVTEKYRDINAGAYPFNIVAYDMAQLVKNSPTVDIKTEVAREILGYVEKHLRIKRKQIDIPFTSRDMRNYQCGAIDIIEYFEELVAELKKQIHKGWCGGMIVDVRKLYAEKEFGDWSDYSPMLGAFGKIAIQVDDNDYQGDSRLLYDENGKIGYLIFGWGSCSGCDALQACETLDDVQKLCDELQSEIKWFDSREEALEWFNTHDWQGDYSWYEEKTKEFVKKCIEYLSNQAPTEKGR